MAVHWAGNDMLTDIELCHVYLRDYMALNRLSDEDEASIAIAKERAAQLLAQDPRNRVSFSVMIDDEEGVLASREDLDAIRKAIEAHGVTLDRIIYESELNRYGDVLIETLRSNVLAVDREHIYLNLSTEDRLLWADENLREMKSIKRIFLETILSPEPDCADDRGERHRSRFWVALRTQQSDGAFIYGCSLLTAVWYLHRLGVEGFCDEDGPQRADRVLNVIPLKYLKSEGIALDLVNLSSATRIRKIRRKIDYVFV